MTRIAFNTGWTVQPNFSVFSQINQATPGTPVTLPHDAMLAFPRSAEHSGGSSNGYYPGGAVTYLKTFAVPDEWRRRRVSLEFQGVYRDSMVFVNGVLAGQRPYGYSVFHVVLDPYLRYGEPNTVRVDARAHLDTRWYSGLGIHRDVFLSVRGLAHLVPDGVRVTTPDVDDARAVVEVATSVTNEDLGTRTLTVTTRILGGGANPEASDSAPITLRPGDTGVVRHRMYVRNPQLWSVDQPVLYAATTSVTSDDEDLDSAVTSFGIRTLRVDPLLGLRINGETVKLRGACIHHDNGILGAAAIGRAEERRIEILKEAGFNAIRSAHNPVSPAMLDACDRLGMLVMDEAFDMWTEGKNPFDYSISFPEWWERDIESMVAKCFNHPSVVMYSIGNEILDAGKPLGAAWGRSLAEKVRSLDESRFVTNGISGFVATISETLPMVQEEAGQLRAGTGVNDLMGQMHAIFDRISLSDIVTEKTAESNSIVDVVGHNYAHARYLGDQAAFPNRIVVGSETLARDIDVIWKLVEENGHVIGDFTWTGWDYLGEAALGRTAYLDEPGQQVDHSAFPAQLAWCGDIDITGHRRPASYYREIVFGRRTDPYIAVNRPEGYGKIATSFGWAWTDSIGSWSWDLKSGDRVAVEIYSAADEVELILNGRSLGTSPAGPDQRYRAQFDVAYEPGEIVAIGRTGGSETGRTVLRSATGPVRIAAIADRQVLRADPSDLGFVTIELVDSNGTLATSRDQEIEVEVSGAGILQALGSARPVTEERYDGTRHSTFDGRVLAAVRPVGPGSITVTVRGDGLESVAIELNAR